MKINSERGNAIVEFVAIGLITQLVIFGYLVKFGESFRSEIAAQTIARQTLRTNQLTGSLAQANSMADQIVTLFGIAKTDVNVTLVDNCSQSGKYSVKVRVRNANYEAQGFCIS